MKREEIVQKVRELETIFDIVRLVDVSRNSQYVVTEAGEIEEQPYKCYAVWKKNSRCENCVSAKAYVKRGKMTKFEFVDQEMYYVVSQYIDVEEQSYMLEMVMRIEYDTIIDVYGKDNFIHSIEEYNKKIYIDPLTGAYNRRYYDEQLKGLGNRHAFAMIDADRFKSINDTYGHRVGDLTLQEMVRTIRSCVRENDEVVRLGGDEFLVTFSNIPEEVFQRRLEDIRERMHALRVEGYPDLRVTVSIGGEYCLCPDMDPIERADVYLYEAKKKRDEVVYHKDE